MERTKRTELTVSKIQEAALKEFGVNGYAGGTINNICKRDQQGAYLSQF